MKEYEFNFMSEDSNASLIIRERYETIRSKISFIGSTLDSLSQSFWSIFSFWKDNIPPFIFPSGAFENLKIEYLRLKDEIEKRSDFIDKERFYILEFKNPDEHILNVILDQYRIEFEVNGLVERIVKLSMSLSQRIAGSGAMKITESHFISQFEQGILMKAYQSLDALSFDLAERTLGNIWIKENKYIPFSIFGNSDYAIERGTFISSIPYEDTFRSRFWSIMAHEIAHILVFSETQKVEEYSKQDPKQISVSVFYDNLNPISRGVWDSVGEIMNRLSWDNKYELAAISQAQELFCDIISVYVCPCVIITASLILPHFYESYGGELRKTLPTWTHPPIDARIFAMKAVLEQNGLLKRIPSFHDYIKSLVTFNERKANGIVLNDDVDDDGQSGPEIMIEYNQIAQNIALEYALPLVKEIKTITPFTHESLNNINKALKLDDYANLSPTEMINLLWIRRLGFIKFDSKLNMCTYYDKRRTEKTMFEKVINSFYKYYADKVYPQVKNKDNKNDLCIDTS
jgi:hypothetical protein